MSNRNWTNEQQEAIECRGTNILVSAGAGSGKTAVLVERVIQHLFDKGTGIPPEIEINEMLVVTFTNAAAAEMRERINKVLTEKFRQEPENTAVSRNLALLPQSSIMTIHSFCLETVKQYFFKVGLDASFRVAIDTELRILQMEVLWDFVEAEYENPDSLIALLADSYGGVRDDAELLRIIFSLYIFINSQPYPEQWVASFKASLDNFTSLDNSIWQEYMCADIIEKISAAAFFLNQAATLCRTANGVPEYGEAIEAEAKAVAGIISDKNFSLERIISAVNAFSFATLPRSKAEEGAKDAVKKLRDKAKTILKDFCEVYSSRSFSLMSEDIVRQHPLLKALAELALKYGQTLTEAKRRRGIVDFSDMEHYCLSILEDNDGIIAAEMRSRFKEVLVDEYQDINAVQERIISLVSCADNKFMVGDMKQGIYKFRLADPSLFLHKYNTYTSHQDGIRIDLSKNFRSTDTVVNAVNFIFSRLMSEKSCAMNYDDSAALITGRESAPILPSDNAEVYFIDKSARSETPDSEELPGARREARVIGERMLQLKKEGYSFSDMTVLMRSLKSWSTVCAEELNDMGIPVCMNKSGSYLETPEVGIIISLLRIIDNPLLDIDFAAVLKSPLANFSLDKLLAIRRQYPGSLYDSVRFAAGNGDSQAADFIKHLDKWRAQAPLIRISQLIRTIYNETGFCYLVGTFPQGEQRQSNLISFYDRACEYENNYCMGLFRFLCYLNDSIEGGFAADNSGAGGGKEEAVRIMSIHNSKGLEFPIVFIAGLGRKFNLKDAGKDVLFHQDLGIAARIADRDKRIKYPTLPWQLMRKLIIDESVAEEMRILYVAMTRARDKLIMTGSADNLAAAVQSWVDIAADSAPLNPYLLKTDCNYLAWLGRSLIRHADGQALRELISLPESGLISDKSNWRVCVVPLESTQPASVAAEQRIAAEIAAFPETEYKDTVSKILSWSYPFKDISGFSSKWTVTEINKLYADHEQANEFLFTPIVPCEESSRISISAADLGTAYHLILEKLDFAAPADETAVKIFVGELTTKGFLEQSIVDGLDIKKIAGFLNSPLGHRIANAARKSASSGFSVKKEKAFTCKLPASSLDASLPAGEYVILQGMIDLVFYDFDGWVIVDYKSGNKNATDEDIIQRYGAQIALYKQAWASITKQPVKEAYIYLLHDARVIKI